MKKKTFWENWLIWESIQKLKTKKKLLILFADLSISIIIDPYDSLKNILSHVFKTSVQQRIFPDSLKIARVTIILKSCDKNIASNYEPTSRVPVFSKVLEMLKII